MKINELELLGFKSFADLARVSIDRGMTGIVGPNGCGKSNLVEALRWAMGETSAKRMRADDMDGVIFGGTDQRPSKPFCKVGITIDNSDRLAPIEFNDADVLKVTRRLDRGEGSSYEVNGKTAKARDIQTLFKDAGIGAGSSALVSQGKVSDIIRAKPIDRKQILEEAAGVTGIASRRHDADLKLRATEQNLEQSLSIGKELVDMQTSLKKQVRQARFKQEVDATIRAAEALMFLVRYKAAEEKEAGAKAAHEANEEAIKALLIELSSVQRRLQETEAAVAPALKHRSDAETAHALAKAAVETVRKQADAARRSLMAVEKNVSRTAADIVKDKAEIDNSTEEYETLKDELAGALDDKENDAELIEEEAVKLDAARAELDAVNERLAASNSELAVLRVEWNAAQRVVSDLMKRNDANRQRLAQSREKTRQMANELANLPDAPDIVRELQEQLDCLMNEYDEALAAREELSVDLSTANGGVSVLEAEQRVLLSEKNALQGSRRDEDGIHSLVKAKAGYEEALAAVLSADLDGSLTEGPKWFSGSDVRAEVPSSSQAFVNFVEVPQQLHALFSGVGLIDEEHAEALQPSLLPGQMLVTRSGKTFRWDGLRSRADVAAAEEIRRSNRLDEIEVQLIDIHEKLSSAQLSARTLESQFTAQTQTLASLKANTDDIRRQLEAARKQYDNIEAQRASLKARIASSEENDLILEQQIEEENIALEDAQEAVSALPDISAIEARLEEIKREQQSKFAVHERCRIALDRVSRDADLRVARIQLIQQKIDEFTRRILSIRQRIAESQTRLEEYKLEEEELRDSPELSPQAEEDALEALERASVELVEASKAAQECDGKIDAARTAVRIVDENMVARREDRARILAEIKAAQDATVTLVREIEERMSLQPQALAQIAGVSDGDELPSFEVCDGRVQSLIKRRETIGVVNLLAEEQLREVEEKLGRSNQQRDELKEAVARLRKQIEAFDEERRERLTDAFARIDGHFRALFTRLFRGGRAFLKLSDSDDPLNAGLEVYASPPGKNLQTMSLLSGGEQALTAVALIFAAFLIRPAPVCVLDEVDAPLDDANIDRLCSLVRELANDETRFLVITHHPLTMAKCDRLYGVTMPERGVSKLVSLDMAQAEKFVTDNF